MTEFDINDAQIQRQVQGLIKSFRALPKDIAKKRMKSAIRKATRPFEPALRSNTPYFSGSLMRSIKNKIKVYDHPTHGAVVTVCGYARGSLVRRRGQFVVSGSGSHGIIVERGTGPRRRANGGDCGVMPARRMMERTVNATKSAVLSSLVTELASALEKTAQELGNSGTP